MNKNKYQKELTAREFRKLLSDNGFKYCSHSNGSHEKWKNDNGKLFVFPVNSRCINRFITERFKRTYINI